MSPEGEGFTPSHRETATARIMAPDGCCPAGKAGPVSARGSWVFSTADGKRRRNNVWRDFRRIVKRAGLPESLTVQDVRKTVNSGTADDGFDG